MGSTALVRQQSDPTVAVALELVGGLFFQTFGIGHIYQGRVAMGIGIMVSYWALMLVNAMLMVVLLGFITAPLTWLFYMVCAPLNAAGEGK